MQTLTLKVDGMSCEGCEERIARVIGGIAGISAIEADHRSAEVRVIFEPGRVSEGDIRAAIGGAGYEVGA